MTAIRNKDGIIETLISTVCPYYKESKELLQTKKSSRIDGE